MLTEKFIVLNTLETRRSQISLTELEKEGKKHKIQGGENKD